MPGLQAKQPCVIDNTNPTRIGRGRYLEAFKAYRFVVTGYYFQSNLEACLERNSLREGREIIPEKGIKGTHRRLELPDYAEGFDHLYYVMLEGGRFLIKDWKDEI